jgi:hypothetical protein
MAEIIEKRMIRWDGGWGVALRYSDGKRWPFWLGLARHRAGMRRSGSCYTRARPIQTRALSPPMTLARGSWRIKPVSDSARDGPMLRLALSRSRAGPAQT